MQFIFAGKRTSTEAGLDSDDDEVPLVEMTSDARKLDALMRQVTNVQKTEQQLRATQQQIRTAQIDDSEKWDAIQADIEQLQETQQQILAAQEEESNRWERFQTEMSVRDQRQKDTLSMLQNIYGLMSQRTKAKDARSRQRLASASETPTTRPANHVTPRRPLADVADVQPRVIQPTAAEEPPQLHRILSEDRMDILFPIRHETEGPPTAVYDPIRISSSSFDSMKLKCTTPTNFARNLMVHFFDSETRKISNFNGSRVLTAQGPHQKRRLDRRIILTMLDQVEMQFPGSTTDKTMFAKLIESINDKCRHT